MEGPLLVVTEGVVIVGMKIRLSGGVEDVWLEGRLFWPSREAIKEGSVAHH